MWRPSPDSLDLLLDKEPLAAACLAFSSLCGSPRGSLTMSCSPSLAANFRRLQRRLRMVFALTWQCYNGGFLLDFFFWYLGCLQTLLGNSHALSWSSSLGPLAI